MHVDLRVVNVLSWRDLWAFKLLVWEVTETAWVAPASMMLPSGAELPKSLTDHQNRESCWVQPVAFWMVGGCTPFPSHSTGMALTYGPPGPGMVMRRQAASCSQSRKQIDHWCSPWEHWMKKPPSLIMYDTTTALSHIRHTIWDLWWGRDTATLRSTAASISYWCAGLPAAWTTSLAAYGSPAVPPSVPGCICKESDLCL